MALLEMVPSLAFTAGIALYEAHVVRVLLVYSALWVRAHLCTRVWCVCAHVRARAVRVGGCE
jgi:hypothetical protein